MHPVCTFMGAVASLSYKTRIAWYVCATKRRVSKESYARTLVKRQPSNKKITTMPNAGSGDRREKLYGLQLNRRPVLFSHSSNKLTSRSLIGECAAAPLAGCSVSARAMTCMLSWQKMASFTGYRGELHHLP